MGCTPAIPVRLLINIDQYFSAQTLIVPILIIFVTFYKTDKEWTTRKS